MNLSELTIGLIKSLAVITNILMFLSGVPVCKQYMANKTTGEASPLPFLCGVLSAVLWLLYGLLKHDDNIAFVNVFGLTLMVSYTVVFYIYTFKKSTTLKQIYVFACLILLITGYVYIEDNKMQLQSRLGSLACGVTLMAIGSPMSKLFYVMKVKSTECLPFPLILMTFIVSTLWFLYGVIDDDAYLILPNLIGALLALVQLSVFVIYPSKPQSPVLSKTTLA